MAIRTMVNEAWEDIEDFKTDEIDGARESADYVRTYVDEAWENAWQNYTPIIKDGVWKRAESEQYPTYYYDGNKNEDDYYWGHFSTDNTLMYGEAALEEDEESEDFSLGINAFACWEIQLDAPPKEVYVEGWADHGLLMYDTSFKVGGATYPINTTEEGNIIFNTGEWLEISVNGNKLEISMDFNSWYSSYSNAYYTNGYMIPVWKINNLWIKY